MGYFDCMDGNKIWEFKCTQALAPEHILQLAIYMYMFEIWRKRRIEELFQIKFDGILDDLRINDEIRFTNDNDEQFAGTITRLCKNGNIYVRVNGAKRQVKTNATKITQNITFEACRLDQAAAEREAEVLKLSSPYTYYLFNILDNHILQLTSDENRLRQMMAYVIDKKFAPCEKISDNDFLHGAEIVRNRYL